MAELVFYKERGKDQKENESVSMEDFIAVKGINAQGNQLFAQKLKQLNWLESLPYEAPIETPKEELEVVDEETVSSENADVTPTPSKETPATNGETTKDDDEDKLDDEGQITLF